MLKIEKVYYIQIFTYRKFSAENSFSKNLAKCSLPTGSFNNSSTENPHLRTLLAGMSFLFG